MHPPRVDREARSAFHLVTAYFFSDRYFCNNRNYNNGCQQGHRMRITPTVERYILHWGEMGTRWGVNRTVSQIHALLYLSPEALRADEIAELLGVARSNVSTSLKELQSWNLVRVIHRLGGSVTGAIISRQSRTPGPC